MELLLPIGGWIVAIILGAFTLVAAVLPKKGTVEHQLLDQFQEERKELHALLAASRRRERLYDDYVDILRAQINNEKPPPPAAWPRELTGGDD